jgi:alpha-N-arabinofuranosidase
MNPDWFLENATRYDDFDRKGPKVFAGEYASHVGRHDAPEGRNNWLSALTEAAFMTGLERNADIVVMTSYAPLLAHKDAWQWNPDLIWFDNLHVMATPNYYIQQLFAQNCGDRALRISENGADLVGQDSLYSSVTIDDDSKELLIKLVNVSASGKTIDLSVSGSKVVSDAEVEMESYSGTLELYNEVGGNDNFPKLEQSFKGNKALKSIPLDPHSVNLLKIKIK